VVVGDYLEVTSGWGRLDKRIVRVKTVNTNDVTFEGIDTSNTTTYPTGSGTGTIRRITAWTNMSQVQGSSTSGGDLQFTDITAIDDTVQKQAPTIRSAVNVNLTVFDDPALAWYTAVNAADDARTPFGVRFSFPNSSKLVANAYWNLQKTPSFQTNDSLKTQVGLTFVADPVRYAT
jgi:hypothetical protein